MPPEVISLLSSPEQRSPQLPTRQQAPVARVQEPAHKNDLELASLPDNLDSSLLEYVDFSTPASKRRRLSPVPDRAFNLKRQGGATKSKGPALPPSDDSIEVDIQSSMSVRRGNTGSRMNILSDEILDTPARSSSVPEMRFGSAKKTTPGRKSKGTNVEVISLDDDIGEVEDEPMSFSQPTTSQVNLSSRTMELLASINGQANSSSDTRARHKEQPSVIFSDDELSAGDRPARQKQKRAPKSSTVDKTAKAQEREAAKARKEQQKAEEKERKQRLKEEKEKQKHLAADIAEVNKSKVDKKISTPEMIIDLPTSLKDSSVGNQVDEYMKHLGVETNFASASMSNLISWRRKVTARYNKEAGHWEPCPLTMQTEDHVLYFMAAQEFVELASTSREGNDALEGHVSKVRRCYPNSKPIYMIEGLSSLMRKNRNARNRAFQTAVLREHNANQQTREPSSNKGSKRSKKANDPPPIDDDIIEDALLQLQIHHGCQIHHTAAAAESAEWIKNFTEHISTIPYRQERMTTQDAGFCMDVGQVKSGQDAHETYIKMLQEVHRVTAPMAYGITTQFGDVGQLVDTMKREGPLMLQDIKKCTNKNGALSDARIGPAVSKRLYKVFTGLDPNSTDI